MQLEHWSEFPLTLKHTVSLITAYLWWPLKTQHVQEWTHKHYGRCGFTSRKTTKTRTDIMEVCTCTLDGEMGSIWTKEQSYTWHKYGLTVGVENDALIIHFIQSVMYENTVLPVLIAMYIYSFYYKMNLQTCNIWIKSPRLISKWIKTS